MMFGHSAPEYEEPPKRGELSKGWGCVTAFSVVFTCGALFFLIFPLLEAWQEHQVRSWPQVECAITWSKVVMDGSYSLAVKYDYRINGQVFSADGVRRSSGVNPDYSKAARLAAKYPVGARVLAHYNPKDPHEAYLEAPGAGAVLKETIPFWAFALCLTAIGVGLFLRQMRELLPRKEPAAQVPADAGPAAPPAEPSAPRRLLQACGGGFGFTFLTAFLVVGLIFLAPFVLAGWRMVASRSWHPAPCTIVSSQVEVGSGGHGPTYHTEVAYSYTVDGREYRSDRYSFTPIGDSSGYAGKKLVVDQYPAGSTATCWVNPADPQDAVLYRGFTSEWFFLIIPLAFAAVGGGGLALAVRRAWHRREDFPRAGVIGVFAFICLFWNGITLAFVWQAVDAWRGGHPDWFLMIFLIPFVAIGIKLIWSSIRKAREILSKPGPVQLDEPGPEADD